MKNHFLIASLAVFLFVLVLRWFAAPGDGSEKVALYTKYYDLKKGEEEGRNRLRSGQGVLQKVCSDDESVRQAVKKFVVPMKSFQREVSFYKAYNAKDYAKTFEFGRQILNNEPDNFVV